jgi:hypothetical protein
MNDEDALWSSKFIKEINKEINWHDNKAIIYKKYCERIKIIKVIFAIVISILSAIALNHAMTFIPIVTVVIAGGITFLEALSNIKQYEELYINYRKTCQALINERRLFESFSKPYVKTDKERLNKYVVKCSDIIKENNHNWDQIQQMKKT